MNNFYQYPLFIGWLLGISEGGDAAENELKTFGMLIALAHNLALYGTYVLAVRTGRRQEIRRRNLEQARVAGNEPAMS